MSPSASPLPEDRVAHKARVAFLGSAAGGALTLVNEVACARLLGVEAYGLYALALVLARISETVSLAGLPVAILRELPVARSQGDAGAAGASVLAASGGPFATGAVLGLLLWTGSGALAQAADAGAEGAAFVRAAAFAVPFMALSEALASVARGLGFPWYYVLVRNLVPPLAFGTFLVGFRGGFQGSDVALAFAAAYAAAALAGLLCARRAGARPSASRLGERARALYAYAWPILVNNLLYLAVGAAPLLALAALRTEGEVGLYRACLQVMMPLEMVELAFVAALAGAFPLLHARRDDVALRQLVQRATRWISLLSLGIALPVVLAREEILSLMGPEFTQAAFALMVLLGAQALLLCTGVLAILLVSCGHQRVETANVAVAAALGLALNLAWIPSMGVPGAAFATAVPCVLVAALRVVQVRRRFGISPWPQRAARRRAIPGIAP